MEVYYRRIAAFNVLEVHKSVVMLALRNSERAASYTEYAPKQIGYCDIREQIIEAAEHEKNKGRHRHIRRELTYLRVSCVFLIGTSVNKSDKKKEYEGGECENSGFESKLHKQIAGVGEAENSVLLHFKNKAFASHTDTEEKVVAEHLDRRGQQIVSVFGINFEGERKYPFLGNEKNCVGKEQKDRN